MPQDSRTPVILTQEWFDSLPEQKQKELLRESDALNARVSAIIELSTCEHPLKQLLLLKAVESFMQDVHASILLTIGEPFFHCVILVANAMLKILEQEKLLAQHDPERAAPNQSSHVN